MKKIKFIVFFISAFSFSQNSGKIEYGLFVELNKEVENLFKNEIKGAENISFSDGAKKLNFTLEFKDFYSKFYIVESIETKDLDAKMALAWSDYENVKYCNTKTKSAYHSNKSSMLFNNEEFIIEEKIFDSWELKNEKKQIQGFVCYKAVGFKIKDTAKGEKKEEIVAWYCPELPFSFGPNGYGGLPGLILELQVRGEVLFGATKISLNEKIDDIDSTKLKGQRITAEEYSKIVRERAGVIMEGR